MPEKETLTYEDALERLERIIEALEDGEVPLQDLITKFEEGSQLLKVCQEKLKEAELKIEQLNLKSGDLESIDEGSGE
ncbi:MAG: exodeoxyribonuclease VII small subunit [Opitutales bacterium]